MQNAAAFDFSNILTIERVQFARPAYTVHIPNSEFFIPNS